MEAWLVEQYRAQKKVFRASNGLVSPTMHLYKIGLKEVRSVVVSVKMAHMSAYLTGSRTTERICFPHPCPSCVICYNCYGIRQMAYQKSRHIALELEDERG